MLHRPPPSGKKTSERLEADAGQITDADLGSLLHRQQAIEAKVRGSGRLRRFSTDIQLMFSLIRDYARGQYREVPWKTIAVVAAALLYVLNPLDLIPDMILLLGLVDDAAVVATALVWVESDLYRYAAWKEARDGGPPAGGPSSP